MTCSQDDRPVHFTLADVLSDKVDLPVSVRVVEQKPCSNTDSAEDLVSSNDESNDSEKRPGPLDEVITLHTVRQVQGQIEVFDEGGKHLQGQLALNNSNYVFEVIVETGAYEVSRFDNLEPEFFSLGELAMAVDKWHRRIVVCEDTRLQMGEVLVAGSEIVIACDPNMDYFNINSNYRAPCWRLAGQYNIKCDDRTLGLVYIPWNAKLPCAVSPISMRLQPLAELADLLFDSEPALTAVPYPVVCDDSHPRQLVMLTSPVLLCPLRIVVATSSKRGAHGLWSLPRTPYNWQFQVEKDKTGFYYRRACRHLASQIDLRALPVWASDRTSPAKCSARKLQAMPILCHKHNGPEVWAELEAADVKFEKQGDKEPQVEPERNLSCVIEPGMTESSRRQEDVDTVLLNTRKASYSEEDGPDPQLTGSSSDEAGTSPVKTRPRDGNVSALDVKKRQGGIFVGAQDSPQLPEDCRNTDINATCPKSAKKSVRASAEQGHSNSATAKKRGQDSNTPKGLLLEDLSDRYPNLSANLPNKGAATLSRLRYFPIAIGVDGRPAMKPSSPTLLPGTVQPSKIKPPLPHPQSRPTPCAPLAASSMPALPHCVGRTSPILPPRPDRLRKFDLPPAYLRIDRSDSPDNQPQCRSQLVSQTLPHYVQRLPTEGLLSEGRTASRSPSPSRIRENHGRPFDPDLRPPMPEPRGVSVSPRWTHTRTSPSTALQEDSPVSDNLDSDSDYIYDLPFPTDGPLNCGPAHRPTRPLPHQSGSANNPSEAAPNSNHNSIREPAPQSDYFNHLREKGSPSSSDDYLEPSDIPNPPPEKQ